MPSPRRSRVLVVASDGTETGAAVATDLERELGCETVLRCPATAAEYVRELGPTIDCVVCCTDEDCDVTTLAEAGPSLPIVVYGDEPPSAPVDGMVALDGGVSALARQVSDRIERERERDRLVEANAKLTALAGLASEITACETPEEVYECTREAVTEALVFDEYVLGLLGEDDRLYPRATEESIEPLSIDEGIAGRTYRTGEPQVVGDVSDDPDARAPPEGLRTCLAVPVGEHGVLQVGREAPDDFEDREVEFLRIVASQAAEALSRLRREADLRVERDRLHTFFDGVCAPAVYVESEGCEEPVLREVNCAYERFFGEADVGEPVSTALPTAVERELFGERLRAADIVRREVERETDRGRRTFSVGMIPVQMPGPAGAAFGLYSLEDELPF